MACAEPVVGIWAFSLCLTFCLVKESSDLLTSSLELVPQCLYWHGHNPSELGGWASAKEKGTLPSQVSLPLK